MGKHRPRGLFDDGSFQSVPLYFNWSTVIWRIESYVMKICFILSSVSSPGLLTNWEALLRLYACSIFNFLWPCLQFLFFLCFFFTPEDFYFIYLFFTHYLFCTSFLTLSTCLSCIPLSPPVLALPISQPLFFPSTAVVMQNVWEVECCISWKKPLQSITTSLVNQAVNVRHIHLPSFSHWNTHTGQWLLTEPRFVFAAVCV